MSNDRELLELAAKAAGIEPGMLTAKTWCDGEGEPEVIVRAAWNPLADDGEALRLAVVLEMQLRILHRENQVSVYGSPDGRVDEAVRGAPLAATRRAIVRAAAEIGRAMP